MATKVKEPMDPLVQLSKALSRIAVALERNAKATEQVAELMAACTFRTNNPNGFSRYVRVFADHD